MIPLIGLILGLIIGLVLNVPIPQAYSIYIGVLVIAALTSLSGVIADILENIYNNKFALIAFLGNMFVSLVIVALGQQLNIALEYLVYFGLGTQMYQNFHRIWHQLALISKEKNKKNLEK